MLKAANRQEIARSWMYSRMQTAEKGITFRIDVGYMIYVLIYYIYLI
ncbi:DUF1508 domain-containing protein [Photobacterium damselae]|nr:YegP family protein [Photobacterium damselae]